MLGFPVPDFDFDDDEPCQSMYNSIPSSLHTLTEDENRELCLKRDLVLTSDTPIRCTSNSAVYGARSSDGSVWAVKITEHKRRVKKEYNKRMKVQDSPFLVKTIKKYDSPTKALLQMELCSQGDIAQFPFDENSVWKMIYDIGNALHQLHSAGWMHLDVSPGNILVTENMFKLADFGTLTLIGQFVEGNEGAGPFVSPEALAYPCGQYPVGAPTDIFSFGVVLLESISKQLAPRGGCDGYAKLRKGEIGLGSPGYPTMGCSNELVSFVNSMLSVNPKARPAAADLISIAKSHL
ncbi:CAMK family protein kinase [Tritrichomonas foetus]|uniref:CAMK family protein kinase n=1 Tax=Tritrichomonas foetus TaxID=1144522 RepID=A0A1J4K3Y7_9EUKA|nr:CAMK family protein kinase [Tritrichomonas foetus]|eukprot:OHT04406.1 CAMK family protein kinase [Tritrichomonas foetus]